MYVYNKESGTVVIPHEDVALVRIHGDSNSLPTSRANGDHAVCSSNGKEEGETDIHSINVKLTGFENMMGTIGSLLQMHGELADVKAEIVSMKAAIAELRNGGEKRYVKAKSAYIRSGPSTDYEQIGSLKRGVMIEVLSEINGWSEVRIDGEHKVYIASDLLKPSP